MRMDQTQAGVAALVQVIEDRDHPMERLGQGVAARVTINEGVGRVTWALEGNHALGLVDLEFRKGAADAVGLAQEFDHL